MKTRDILSAFGLKLRYRRDCFGQRFIAECNEARIEAKTTRQLIKMIVPAPPAALSPSPGAIAAWAKECASSAYGSKVDPDQLAKAAFAAFGLVPSQEALNVFADAVRAWKPE